MDHDSPEVPKKSRKGSIDLDSHETNVDAGSDAHPRGHI